MNLYAPRSAAKAYALLENWQRAEALASAMIERSHLIIRPPVPVMDADHPLYAMNRMAAEDMLTLQRGGRAEPLLLRARIRLQTGNPVGAREDLIEVRRLGVDKFLESIAETPSCEPSSTQPERLCRGYLRCLRDSDKLRLAALRARAADRQLPASADSARLLY